MAYYYNTRAKARSDLESDEVEQRDSAPIAGTSPYLTTSVGLIAEFTRGSESVSTESAGPVFTHLELLPVGGHPSVGGPGVLGSADPLLVGVSTLGYPSEHAEPIDSAFGGEFVSTSLASSAETMITPDINIPTATSRQPPTATEVTAAASRSPTILQKIIFVHLLFTV